ncbi:hypothetical protein V2J09_018734 [Rumex salicifolius]
MGIPRPLRAVLVAGATVTGGVFVLSLASSVTLRVVRSAVDAKMKKSSKPCQVCKGKGAYSCKLCKCNGTIEWSPMYDPIAINPCQCPTCEGRWFVLSYQYFVLFIQKCLNCLGKGYYV